MTEKLTKEDLETLVRQANNPLPGIAGPARQRLIEISHDPESLPDEPSKVWVSSIVKDWILPSR
jgi:hypothetical protein